MNHCKLIKPLLLFLCSIIAACGGGSSAPTNALPSAPANVIAIASDGQTSISWNPQPGVTTFNLYWSTSSGVSKTNGDKINSISSPIKHSGLVNTTTYYYVVTAINTSGESTESAQVFATPVDSGSNFDPLFSDQWHLQNTGQDGGTPAEDSNVLPVWSMNLKGEGIRIAIVDEDLEISHEDLATNVATGLSHNYLTGLTDPACPVTAVGCGHGTAVAGVAAARDFNNLGVRGVAPRANIVGYNLLQSRNISNEADAMIRNAENIHVSNNSWGPPDNADLHATPLAWRDAIATGLNLGRNGKGTIYVWAAGNGAIAGDNANYDGYANHRSVNAICSVDDKGVRTEYSEPGANLRVCAASQELATSGHGITTTDRSGATGFNINGSGDYSNTNYSKTFTGTSASVPIVAGTVALLLQAQANLGWRDVQLILAQSARRNDPTHQDWSQNGAGHWVNHDYGFGVIDANNAISTALSWSNVATEITHVQSSSPLLAIPDDNITGVSDTMTISGSSITTIEFIEITFSATDHTFAGDLEITLTNESTGTISRLSGEHSCPGLVCTAYDDWIFSSTRHLGEAADGQWTLTVADRAAVDVGTFQSWGLKFYGR